MARIGNILSALTGLLLLLCSPAGSIHAQALYPFDQSSAVTFAYHRIGEDAYPDTNLRIAQFESHVTELLEGSYTVMALPDILNAVKDGIVLAPKTVALTFEGGHRSVLDRALPLLLENEIPFTVFVATDKADWNSPNYLNWDDLRKLKRHKNVSIGIHPAAYTRLTDAPREEILRQINKARSRYREELGEDPKLFAYPFGEYSAAYHEIIASQNFLGAFGQHSGVIHSEADFLALPRFAMTESYGGLERFRLTAHAMPLPVRDVQPKDPHLSGDTPAIGFTVSPDLKEGLDKLSCFISGHGKPAMEKIGDSRIELRLNYPIEEDRTRVNCTMPGPVSDPGEPARWRWFGMLLTKPAVQFE